MGKVIAPLAMCAILAQSVGWALPCGVERTLAAGLELCVSACYVCAYAVLMVLGLEQQGG